MTEDDEIQAAISSIVDAVTADAVGINDGLTVPGTMGVFTSMPSIQASAATIWTTTSLNVNSSLPLLTESMVYLASDYAAPKPRRRATTMTYRADLPGAEKAMVADSDELCGRANCRRPLREHSVATGPSDGMQHGFFRRWKQVQCNIPRIYTMYREDPDTGERRPLPDMVVCGLCMRCSYEGSHNDVEIRRWIDKLGEEERERVNKRQSAGEIASFNGWEDCSNNAEGLECMFCGQFSFIAAAETDTTQEEVTT